MRWRKLWSNFATTWSSCPRKFARERGSWSRRNNARPCQNPLLQGRYFAKSLRVYLPGHGHPVDGGTLRQAVNAHAILGFGRRSLQPHDRAFFSFFRRNEPAFAGRTLKFLKFVHGVPSIGSFPGKVLAKT